MGGCGTEGISIHTALAGCDETTSETILDSTIISIHTALAGCDHPSLRCIKINISIHTALAGCDTCQKQNWFNILGFQSTQPSQAVTLTAGRKGCGRKISIHTALAGCDFQVADTSRLKFLFQSTQPSQAVTVWMQVIPEWDYISIHTALAGCDQNRQKLKRGFTNFNPHSPRRL